MGPLKSLLGLKTKHTSLPGFVSAGQSSIMKLVVFMKRKKKVILLTVLKA